MSYDILYNTVFLRSEEGITPVVLSGCSNVFNLKTTAAGHTIETRERSWECYQSLIGVSEETLMERVKSFTGHEYQEHWKYHGKWVDDAALMKWATNAIKNAATTEDLLLVNSPIFLRMTAYISVWPKGDGWSRRAVEKSIYSTAELDEWIREARTYMEKSKEQGNTCYPIIEFNHEDFMKPRALPDEIFLVRKGAYLSNIEINEEGNIRSVSYGKKEKGKKFTKAEYLKLLAMPSSYMLKGFRPVSAFAKKSVNQKPAIIVVSQEGSSICRYVRKVSAYRVSMCAEPRGAKQFVSMRNAETSAEKLNKKYSDHGYSFSAVAAE